MTFEKAVDIYADYLSKNSNETDARATILEFLEWEEPKEDLFAQTVRIVLVSANFSKEVTTAVLWLNEHDLDIRCIRLTPYDDNGRIFIVVQQIIPLPEAAEYQIQIREKEQSERRERAERNPKYYKFWEHLLALAEGKTDLHANLVPSTTDSLRVKKWENVSIWYVVNQHSSRVGLYTRQAKIYDELYAHKDEIEAAFGEALRWKGREDRKISVVAYDMTIGGYMDEADWEKIQTAMIDAMIRFVNALSPFIANLVSRR